MTVSRNGDVIGQNHEPLHPLPWGWYLGAGAVIALAGVLVLVGWDPLGARRAGDVLSAVFVLPLIFLGTGVLAGMANHSRQTVQDTGVEADRARLLSNLVQPALARFCFAAATVSTVGGLGSVFGPGRGAWSSWGTAVALGVLTLVFLRRSATINRRVEEQYPSGKAGKIRWGLFYFDPDDDEMIVNHGGLNIPNLGNRYTWVLLGFLAGFCCLLAVLGIVAE